MGGYFNMGGYGNIPGMSPQNWGPYPQGMGALQPGPMMSNSPLVPRPAWSDIYPKTGPTPQSSGMSQMGDFFSSPVGMMGAGFSLLGTDWKNPRSIGGTVGGLGGAAIPRQFHR